MKLYLVVLLLSALFTDNKHAVVRVITDGFNCSEGVVIADQIRELVENDTLLKSYSDIDSIYIVVEITSFRDGGTAVINAAFATVTPLQKSQLDYKFTRRLVSKTLVDMREISANILEKIHLIRKN
jgi:hypothetical protein